MAERDATVARGTQPRPVAPRQAGQSPADQGERGTDSDAAATEEINGVAGPDAAASAAPGAAEGSGEPPAEAGAASPDDSRRGPVSPEDPTPGITGTAEGDDVSETGPEAAGTDGGEAPGDAAEGPAQTSADAADGHAESRTEGPDEPGSGQTAPEPAAAEAADAATEAEPDAEGEPDAESEAATAAGEGEAAAETEPATAEGEAAAAAEADAKSGDAPEGEADEAGKTAEAAEAGIDAAAAAQVKAEDEPARLMPPGFPTEESLAEQDEATTQLRRAIDELRQLLDVDTGPIAVTPTPRRRRRRLLPLLLAVLVAAALVAAVAVLVTSGGDDDGAAAPGPRATETAGAGDPGMPAPLTPAPGTAPASGPGVTTPGTLVVVRLAGDETLHITEQAILPGPATAQIPLALSDVRRLGGEIAALRPEVTQLRASLDGRPAPVRAADAGSWFVPLSGRPTKVALSYTIDRAVIVTRTPTDTTRVLGLVTPLLGRGLSAQGLPLIVRTTGTKMLGATCPDAPAAVSLCGVGDGRGNWTATVPESLNPVVVVQADLPRG